MAESYGTLPTEIMKLPAEDFWMNARVHAATATFKQEAREQTPTDRAVEDAQADADDRAEFAEDVDGQTSTSAQRAALTQLEDQVDDRGVGR